MRTDALDTLRAAFVDALVRGDAHAAAQFYAEDARVLVPGTLPMDGRPAIEAFWRAGVESGMCGLVLEPTVIDAEPAFACEIGNYTLRAAPRDEPPAAEEGRYLVVHRLAGGAWCRALEIFEPGLDPANRELSPSMNGGR